MVNSYSILEKIAGRATATQNVAKGCKEPKCYLSLPCTI